MKLPPDSAEYQRRKYESVWKDAKYARTSPGLRSIGRVLEYCMLYGIHDVAFLGSGSGHDAFVLEDLGYEVQLLDIARNSLQYESLENYLTLGNLWDMPYTDNQHPLTYCADVLEHIPETRVMDALREIHRVTEDWALMQVSCRDSGKEHEYTGGEPLHMTVQEPIWWKRRVVQAGFDIVNWDYSHRTSALFLYGRPVKG